MYMYKTSGYLLYHAPQYMIERLEGLTVHTDYESTIGSLYMDIDIFAWDNSFYLFESDPKSLPKLLNECLYCVLHTDNWWKILQRII